MLGLFIDINSNWNLEHALNKFEQDVQVRIPCLDNVIDIFPLRFVWASGFCTVPP